MTIIPNSFQVQAKATKWLTWKHPQQLPTLLKPYPWQTIKILGEGTNILLLKSLYHEPIIQSHYKALHYKITKDEVHLFVGAGYHWDDLVQFCARQHWWGIENLSAIPGSVGAAPIQNIGAYGSEIKEVLTKVLVYNLKKQTFQWLKNQDCQFQYRDSLFKQLNPNPFLIVAVCLQLSTRYRPNLSYKDLKHYAEQYLTPPYTPYQIAQAVRTIRAKKLPDPTQLGNAGSFFKNPLLTQQQFTQLKQRFPSIPYFKEQTKYKIPAAWLIEKAGLKGIRKNGVGTYPKQPLVIVNYHAHNGKAIYNFAMEIRKKVYEAFGVWLELEVRVWE